MDDSRKKAMGGPDFDNIIQPGPGNFQSTAESDTGSSSSSSQAAVRAAEASEESSALDEEDDIFIPVSDEEDDEDDDFIQVTVHRYFLHQLNASETATRLHERISIIDTKSLRYDVLWWNILRIAGREDTDQRRLVLWCKAIFEEKDEKKWKEAWKVFNIDVRYQWDRILGNSPYNDAAGDPLRRAFSQFLAHLCAGTLWNDRSYFLGQFSGILESKRLDRPVTADDNAWSAKQLLHLADYFRIAGAWMKHQFNVEPNVEEGYLKEHYTYT